MEGSHHFRVSFKLRVDVDGDVCLETDVTMVSVDGAGKKVELPALLN